MQDANPAAGERSKDPSLDALAAIYRRALERRRAALEPADREDEAGGGREEATSDEPDKP